MLLRYFYDQKLAHASYLVGCQATGEALVMDPGRDIDPYVEVAESQGMRIVAVTETHIHADLLSGARELAERTGAQLFLSDEGDADWKYQYHHNYDHHLVKDGDIFKIGNIKFKVLHTPGHTPEHISFIITDTAGANKPMGIFTGDFVFVGDVGRPDLLEAAAGIKGTAEPGARRMFHSLQRFKALPDYMQVWPAHGAGSACGKALGAIPSSTVGYEKLFNWAMNYTDEDAFVQALLSGQPEPPRYFAMMKKLNKEGPKVLHSAPMPEQLPFTHLADLLAQGAMLVDTRSTDAFAAAHIPGTINIPFDNSFTTWSGWLLNYETPYYLIVDAHLLTDVVRALRSIGLDNVLGYSETSAISAWPKSGRHLQSYEVVTPKQAADKVLNGEMFVLDVRNSSEWAEGHLPGANHIMLGYLSARFTEVPTDRPILVQCRSGGRSAIGASLLQSKGVPQVINLLGGFREWAAEGLPIER
ncbi:MAG: MBL fold metallo-hydrolase [Chloroflexales bacterium]|nr:MBL fold metallo-hydrolase [Chloroflexales bacterium]